MSRNINDLREILFKTMEDLRDGKIDVESAKSIAGLGQVIVNSAVAETKHLREVGGSSTKFIEDSNPVPKIGQREETLSEHEKVIRKYVGNG